MLVLGSRCSTATPISPGDLMFALFVVNTWITLSNAQAECQSDLSFDQGWSFGGGARSDPPIRTQVAI